MNEPETTAVRLPRGQDRTARAWLEDGAPAGSAPVPAASVCLLRRGDGDAVEVLWLTRGRRLRTWPGLLAFPGGVVEPVDRARRADDHGPPDRFTVLARAAARECEEETGVAVPARGLVPFCRWVTPEHEPRRFDTTFLLGAVGDGAPPGATGARGDDRPAHRTAEVHEHGWAEPHLLLAQVLAGDRAALPPTRAVLRALADAVTAAAQEPDDALPSAPTPADATAGGPGARLRRVVERAVAAGTLVPVVPRATWHEGPPAADGAPDVDLLLPRHAGPVP